MKTHTVKGAKILEQVAELADIIPIVRSHHERWDGLGYPDGTPGEKTPLLARIVAVADAFDAMTSDRPVSQGDARSRSAFVEAREDTAASSSTRPSPPTFIWRSSKRCIIQEMQSETKKLNMQASWTCCVR